MLKNKIYNYFSLEILKNFLIILFALTSIAWTVRSVNFLELIVDNGHSVQTYLIYSLLNITNILTKFIPISFLLALVASIIKFDNQNELIVLWTSGISKIQLVNLFLLLSILIFSLQLIFAIFITPSALNKSRELIRSSNLESMGALIKSNDFSDAFQNITFFVEKRNSDNEMQNIFIRDENNTFKNLISSQENSSNTTIIAKTGFINNTKLILNNGLIQSQDNDGKINIIEFEKTELPLDNLTTRKIIQPKIQETRTGAIMSCLLDSNKNLPEKELVFKCPQYKNLKDLVENISRRIGMPLYIPLLSLISSFLLFSNKKKKFRVIDKYLYFFYGFLILIVAEILVRYSGLSKINTYLFFLFPILLIPIIYFILFKTMREERS